MFPVVRLTLSLLRVASHASLFVEAQRLLLRFLRPSQSDIIVRLESRLLSCIRHSNLRHIWVNDHNNHRIHVIEATPQSCRRRKRKTVVLVHGHSMAAAFWYRNIDDLTRLGFRVLAVDLLGWGRSQRARFVGSSADDTAAWFVDSLKAVLNQVVPDTENEGEGKGKKKRVVSEMTTERTIAKTGSRKVVSVDMRRQQQKMRKNQMHKQQQQQQQRRVPVTLIGHSLGAYVVYELTRHVNSSPNMNTPSSTKPSSSSSSSSHAKKYNTNSNDQQYEDNIVIDKLILVSPAAATRPVEFSSALYFSLPPQAIVRRGGLLGFLLFSMKYPRNAAYMRDHLREFTYRLAMQSPASGESAIRPIIRFTGWRTAECVRPLSELVIMDSTSSTTAMGGLPPSTTAERKMKTLIIAGDSDSSMPVQGVIDLYRLMKSRNFDVSLSVFDQCDHCPQLEQPLRFADTISDFLCASPNY